MSSDSHAVPSVFFSATASCLASDATDLYYRSVDEVMRTPIGSFAPTVAGVFPPVAAYSLVPYHLPLDFALHGDDIFALDRITDFTTGPVPAGVFLSRAPKSGGQFEHVRALGAGIPHKLQGVGDRFFFDVGVRQGSAELGFSQRRVLTAGFADEGPPLRVLELPDPGPLLELLWVGTAEALYWSTGQAIYKQPLPKP
jgi:hypothetical protein